MCIHLGKTVCLNVHSEGGTNKQALYLFPVWVLNAQVRRVCTDQHNSVALGEAAFQVTDLLEIIDFADADGEGHVVAQVVVSRGTTALNQQANSFILDNRVGVGLEVQEEENFMKNNQHYAI